jgi:hypothetical protein
LYFLKYKMYIIPEIAVGAPCTGYYTAELVQSTLCNSTH